MVEESSAMASSSGNPSTITPAEYVSRDEILKVGGLGLAAIAISVKCLIILFYRQPFCFSEAYRHVFPVTGKSGTILHNV